LSDSVIARIAVLETKCTEYDEKLKSLAEEIKVLSSFRWQILGVVGVVGTVISHIVVEVTKKLIL